MAGNPKRAVKIPFCFFRIWWKRLECDFTGNAMHLCLAPLFLRSLYCVYRVVNATPRILMLAKFRVSHCQIP